MLEIGIADINKTPSIIDKLDNVTKIVNKKTKSIKGFFIPIKYKSYIESTLEKIEYQNFLSRNKNMIGKGSDDTLQDGLNEEY